MIGLLRGPRCWKRTSRVIQVVRVVARWHDVIYTVLVVVVVVVLMTTTTLMMMMMMGNERWRNVPGYR